MKYRSFIALETPDPVRETLSDKLTAWNRIPGVNWVRPENLHLTLIFLGDVEVTRMGVVDHTLHECLEDQSVYPMRVLGLELFPAKQPRLIWATLQAQDDAIFKLHKNLYYQLKSLAPEIDAKPLKLHITLGRIKASLPPAIEQQIMQSTVDQGIYDYDTLSLYRSVLKPEGPIYHPISQYQLS